MKRAIFALTIIAGLTACGENKLFLANVQNFDKGVDSATKSLTDFYADEPHVRRMAFAQAELAGKRYAFADYACAGVAPYPKASNALKNLGVYRSQLDSLTKDPGDGLTDLWAAVWASYLTSPLLPVLPPGDPVDACKQKLKAVQDYKFDKVQEEFAILAVIPAIMAFTALADAAATVAKSGLQFIEEERRVAALRNYIKQSQVEVDTMLAKGGLEETDGQFATFCTNHRSSPLCLTYQKSDLDKLSGYRKHCIDEKQAASALCTAFKARDGERATAVAGAMAAYCPKGDKQGSDTLPAQDACVAAQRLANAPSAQADAWLIYCDDQYTQDTEAPFCKTVTPIVQKFVLAMSQTCTVALGKDDFTACLQIQADRSPTKLDAALLRRQQIALLFPQAVFDARGGAKTVAAYYESIHTLEKSFEDYDKLRSVVAPSNIGRTMADANKELVRLANGEYKASELWGFFTTFASNLKALSDNIDNVNKKYQDLRGKL